MDCPRRVLVALIGVALAVFAGSAWADGGGKKPVVSGGSADTISWSSAVLKGTVHPEGQATTYIFEYGPTAAYGGQTQVASAGSGDSAQPVSAQVTGLTPASTYHFHLVATNNAGTARGVDKTFTTLAAPPGVPGTDPGTDPGLKTPSGSAVPEAELGKSVLVAPATGDLRVRRPGSDSFVALAFGSKLPVGSEIDARHGSLALTAALPSGATETGYFGAGRFKLTQDKRGYVDLYLRGSYCSRSRATAAGTAGVSASAARKKPGRRLWGRDHGGRFRTHGRNSHATVRGTRWLVADSCKGTYTRVAQGVVVVRDTVRKKRVVLKAGEHYLARPRH
jgi:hypothetical protein